MTMQDDQYMAEPSHGVAMAIMDIMQGISDLGDAIDRGHGLSVRDMEDLRASKFQLGLLVNRISEKRAA